MDRRARPRPPTRSGIPTRRRGERGARPPGPTCPCIPREVDAAGDTLYQTYCAVCHGAGGRREGAGRSADRARRRCSPAGPAAYTDGYIYSIIRYGRGVMPRYGDKVYLPADRWAIVNHVRKLQGQAPLRPSRRAPPPASRRRRAPPARPARGPDEPGTLHERLVERSLAGRYDLFLGVGGGLAVLGLILFVVRPARATTRRPRLAALPRELAVLHRPRRRQRGLRRRCRRSPTPSGRA